VKYVVSIDGREIEVVVDADQVTVAGRTRSIHGAPQAGTGLWRFEVDGAVVSLPLTRTGRGQWVVSAHGEQREAEVVDERTRHIRSLVQGGKVAGGGGSLRAPMPGLVVRVLVEAGQTVAAGQPLLVLEAMKMENELRAPAAGVVQGVGVKAGQAVEKGQVLVTLQA
jgi:pyruvate carboxylase subunit B